VKAPDAVKNRCLTALDQPSLSAAVISPSVRKIPPEVSARSMKLKRKFSPKKKTTGMRSIFTLGTHVITALSLHLVSTGSIPGMGSIHDTKRFLLVGIHRGRTHSPRHFRYLGTTNVRSYPSRRDKPPESLAGDFLSYHPLSGFDYDRCPEGQVATTLWSFTANPRR